MIKTRTVFYLTVLLCIWILMSGCQIDNKEKKEIGLSLIAETDPDPVTLVSHYKKEISAAHLEKEIEDSFAEIYDVAVIRGEKNTLIVYKVKHMQRFWMKKIEKNLKEMLDKNYPNERFVVSSDYKIFLEALKLAKKMEDPNYSMKEANEELERIIKLKKRQA